MTSVATLLPCIPSRCSPIRRVGAAVSCAGSAWCRRLHSPPVSGPWLWRWPGGRRLRSPTGLLRAPQRPRRTTAVRPGPRLAARRACRHPARGRGSHCRPRHPLAPRPLRLAVLRPGPPPLTRWWAAPHRSPPTRPAALRPGTPSRRAREAPMASSPPGPALADPYHTGALGPSRRASRARPSSHRRSRAPRGHWVLVSLVMLVFAAGLTVEGYTRGVLGENSSTEPSPGQHAAAAPAAIVSGGPVIRMAGSRPSSYTMPGSRSSSSTTAPPTAPRPSPAACASRMSA